MLTWSLQLRPEVQVALAPVEATWTNLPLQVDWRRPCLRNVASRLQPCTLLMFSARRLLRDLRLHLDALKEQEMRWHRLRLRDLLRWPLLSAERQAVWLCLAPTPLLAHLLAKEADWTSRPRQHSDTKLCIPPPVMLSMPIGVNSRGSEVSCITTTSPRDVDRVVPCSRTFRWTRCLPILRKAAAALVRLRLRRRCPPDLAPVMVAATAFSTTWVEHQLPTLLATRQT